MRFNILSLIVILLSAGLYFFVFQNGIIRDGIIIQTASGRVQGVIEMSRDGRDYFSWYKIPFARPPVGDLRFADPLPPQNWENVLDGRKIGPECAQVNIWTTEILKNIVGEEDCLHLNINVPSKVYEDVLNGRRAKVPVIFYIHGGGYFAGSGALYSPAYFMDEDVVTVIINYRLDLLGFLTTGDGVIRGNAGLKDQTMALRWVQKNIQYFGGDPNQVSIFGTSAGAVSAHYQMLSPLSKGLFRKVFAQSGSAPSSWGFNSLESSLEKAKGIAIKFQCSTNDTRRLAECLRKTPVTDLLMTRMSIKTDWFGLNPQEEETSFGPTSEAITDDHAFITTDPLKTVQDGKAHRVPLMLGHSTHEGLFASYSFIRDPGNMKKFEVEKYPLTKRFFRIWNPKWEEIVGDIFRFYFPEDQEELLSYDKKLEIYTQFFSDGAFNLDCWETVLHQRKYSPVYYYLFNKTDSMDLTHIILSTSGKWPFLIEAAWFQAKFFILESVFGIPPKYYGIGHTIDTLYFFPAPMAWIYPENKLYGYSKDLVKLVADFSRDETKMEFRGAKFRALPKIGDVTVFEFKNENAVVVPEPNKKRLEYLRTLDMRGMGGANIDTISCNN